MKTFALLIALALVLSGCDTAINMGISLGSQIVVDGVGWVVRSSDQPDFPRSPGTSQLVCNPVEGKIVDPSTECHSETVP